MENNKDRQSCVSILLNDLVLMTLLLYRYFILSTIFVEECS